MSDDPRLVTDRAATYDRSVVVTHSAVGALGMSALVVCSACLRVGYAPVDEAAEVDSVDGGDTKPSDASVQESGIPNPDVRDASGNDASPSDASPSDASPSDASPTDASLTDASPADAEAGTGSSILVHRYSFDGSGTTVEDSAGDSDGEIVNTSLTGTGSFRLTFTGEEYAILPAGMISSLTDATFEAWVIWDGQLAASYHPRLFDFGSNAGQPGEQGAPTSYFYLTPSYNENGVARAAYSRDGQESFNVTARQAWLELGVEQSVHFAVLFDDATRELTLYVNGQHIETVVAPGHLSDIHDDNGWLGRSPVVSDSHFGGEIDEFRIYAGLLPEATIVAHAAAGPDAP